MRSKGVTQGAGTALTAALMLAGCGASNGVDAQGPVPPASSLTPAPTTASPSASPAGSAAPSTTASPSTPAGDEKSAILAQYRAFYESLEPLSKTEYNARYEAMKKLAVDPELTQVMGAIATAQHFGEAYYGTPVLRPKIESLKGDTASILDCQDTSVNGRKKVATGEIVTAGRKNSYAQVTMKRGADGLWRVSTIGYAAAGSCNAEA